jgi:uncharacterized membrane protein (UPF0127 family)
MRTGTIVNITRQSSKPIKVKYCDSFLSKFMGLMFRDKIDENEGILLMEDKESRINTAIHMFFMKFNITAIWINSQYTVSDVKLALSWRPYYASQNPALYVLETHPSRLSEFQIGDQLKFIYD